MAVTGRATLGARAASSPLPYYGGGSDAQAARLGPEVTEKRRAARVGGKTRAAKRRAGDQPVTSAHGHTRQRASRGPGARAALALSSVENVELEAGPGAMTLRRASGHGGLRALTCTAGRRTAAAQCWRASEDHACPAGGALTQGGGYA